MKALIGREDIDEQIRSEYRILAHYTSPGSSVQSFEHHLRKIHILAFRALINRDVYDF